MRTREGSGCDDEQPRYGPWVWSAYRAYHELLRDKLKKRFEAEEGPWMDRLADTLVELVNVRWEGGAKQAKAEKKLLGELDALFAE